MPANDPHQPVAGTGLPLEKPRPATRLHVIVMRDLSQMLWCDLQSDEERIVFLESGRARDTGIIAQVMVDEIANAFKVRIAAEKLRVKAREAASQCYGFSDGTLKLDYSVVTELRKALSEYAVAVDA